jgi:hypothetical protein
MEPGDDALRQTQAQRIPGCLFSLTLGVSQHNRKSVPLTALWIASPLMTRPGASNLYARRVEASRVGQRSLIDAGGVGQYVVSVIYFFPRT